MEDLKPFIANSSHLTPLGFLDRAATVYGDKTSIIYNNTTFTWSQTNRRCLQLASSLSSLGIRRGDVVSIVAPNVPAAYEVHFAVPFAAAVLNNINTRLDAHTISVMLHHCESKLVFVDCMSRSLVHDAISLMPANAQRPILILITDDSVEEATSLDGFLDTYEGLVAKGDSNFQWIRPQSEWDPIVLNYTSGTTSAPKGVVHCHRGIFTTVVNILIDWEVPKQVRFLWTVNMFHVNGWNMTWGMAAVGGINICVRKFDAATVFTMIERYGVTHMCGAPVVLNMLNNAPTKKFLTKPVHVLIGGAPPPSSVLQRSEELGFVLTHAYGLTEIGGVMVTCAWKEGWNILSANERARLKARQGVRTIGLAELDVVDPNSSRSVKRDGLTLGEVVVKGGSVMLGYLKDSEANSKCFKNGWFYTGDVGVMHADGYLEIKDRSKDVIISGGENLSSVEVESVLYSNPAVNEAAVVARPDEFWGETPCAFVSLREGLERKPTEKEIMEYCRARMPHFMAPKTVVFKDEIPKNSVGKIQKHILRKEAKAMGSLKYSRL